MPWCRKRGLKEPSLALVEAAYRIRDEIQPRVFLLENVREAQRWLGPAILYREPFYFWGDAVLIPRIVRRRSKESYSGSQRAERARIPFALSFGIASAVAASWRR